jgi:peptide/nickel transport system substrate-binding protein
VKIIGESAARRLQLTKGDLDIADALPVDQFAALKQEGKWRCMTIRRCA